MKWRNNKPKHGDTTTRMRFAWLPVELSNGDLIWLESYFVKQKFFANVGGLDYNAYGHSLAQWIVCSKYQLQAGEIRIDGDRLSEIQFKYTPPPPGANENIKQP